MPGRGQAYRAWPTVTQTAPSAEQDPAHRTGSHLRIYGWQVQGSNLGRLIATATRIGATFYTFGVVVLATLSFLRAVTFERVVQSGLEDHGYAQRIARLRGFYFDYAPQLTGYLVSVPPPQRLSIQGLDTGSWRVSRTIAGMVGVVTAVLAGAGAGLIATVAADHSAVAGFATGGVVAVATVAALMRLQRSAWRHARQHPYFDCQPVAGPQPGSEQHSR